MVASFEEGSGGGLTAARALARLRRASPAAVHCALVAVALVVVSDVVVGFDSDQGPRRTSCSRSSGWASRRRRARRSAH